MKTLLARLALATLLFSLAILPAQAEENVFSRSGWYVGVGGGVAFDFFDDVIQDATMGLVESTPAGSFNARGGYRWLSWLAFEGMYEGSYGFGTKVAGVDLGSLDTHSLVATAKFVFPKWRYQPYVLLGVGAQAGNFKGKGILDPLDTSRWDFVFRPAVGVDAYLNKNWLVNFEIAPSLRVRTFNTIPSETTDNLNLTVSAGIGYRF